MSPTAVLEEKATMVTAAFVECALSLKDDANSCNLYTSAMYPECNGGLCDLLPQFWVLYKMNMESENLNAPILSK